MSSFSLISCDILLKDLFLRFTIDLIPDQSFFMIPLFCVERLTKIFNFTLPDVVCHSITKLLIKSFCFFRVSMVEFPKQSITTFNHFLNVRIYPWLGFKPQFSGSCLLKRHMLKNP